MDPGMLRHRVDIYSTSVTSPDGLGGGTRTATLIGSVWAAIEPVSGIERMIASGLRAEMTYTVTIRYPSFTVNQQDHVVWSGRTFVVKAISQENMITEMLELTVVEGA